MKRFLAMVLAAWMVCATALGETSDVDEEVRKIFKMYKAVGGTVLAAKDGEIIYQYNYGFANRQSKTPVTENTYFRVASVTKMVSAIRIMQLVEAGALDLDADLSDYLGFTLRNPYAREVPITLRHLMTHTSSLNQNGSYGRRGLEALLALEGNHRANYYDEIPGTKYRYSNFGAGVMGSVLEAVTGKNVQDTVAEGVFEPLGIDAAYHASYLATPSDIATCYNSDGTVESSVQKSLTRDWEAEPSPDTHYNLTVGKLWITGRDLCRLGIALCDGGEADSMVLLQPETVAEMLASQQGRGGVRIDSPYGLCVNRNDTLLADRLVYGHQGMSGGITANVYFEPESRFVFVMISNGCSNKLQNRVCAISRKLFNLMWEAFGE